MRERSLRKSCDAGLRCEKSRCFLRSSDARCLRFGLLLRFGLRCERPRCQIACDSGQAMRSTKVGTLRGGVHILKPPSVGISDLPLPPPTCPNPPPEGYFVGWGCVKFPPPLWLKDPNQFLCKSLLETFQAGALQRDFRKIMR